MKNENDILKWFDNELSELEIERLKTTEDFEVLNKIAHYASQMQAPQIDADKALEQFKTKNLKKEEPKVIPLNFKTFLRVAAILVVLLTSSYFLFFNSIKSYSTDIAQTETLRLPDDSQVVLNAQSDLTFNKKSWKDSRTLTLDGEAYFKVTKGQKFTVQTEIGNVQVLGTEFNVKERENYFEVTCYEGSVQVTQNENSKVLTPGKTFRLVDGQVINVEDFKATSPAWLSKESSFINVPLWQVIAELEIQYDIQISTKDVNITEPFTGSFTHTDKDIALQSVTIPLKLSYKTNGKKVEFYNYESN
ncbi:FecR family protein [Seonamhaeicola sp. ML3]|uniref:FecR family protein n=1 Tax=Seonamhaeicola sp. ML3 TaxID=2937786 RepID=UPI00200DBDE2|nr:FecR domain-containing protein [Seonamhaeicola sp. ML3]